ncbi:MULTISPECIES: molybdenum cofactor biosynthesis protein MoaE [unclassified Sphingobium]|uniref:molybdenum cofactor biosynthesis protein MoaE n=1 Tax=unclassified Sphingobium TaxID=2611147 RepID=UPI0022246BC3|nr:MULTISPECIES: molybdenum cofactor biosynthesis protein MoaE [unclassified Sphingobium]MCW2393987.1 molybdopterin synthase catalytic subunit [Sphingobium sp. B8D3B]MCW2417501.1 molybdopterin synthase catalytic subunit [Sphingobium sp. B8D3C]
MADATPSVSLSVTAEDFDPGRELARLEGLDGGGIASFTGLVRDDGGLRALLLEHYPAMTQAQIGAVVEEACARWPLLGVTVIHRFGELPVGARIVFVGTASAHRVAALESCAFLIDWLKVSAPFWKQEIRHDGSAGWVEAKGADDARAAIWRQGRLDPI